MPLILILCRTDRYVYNILLPYLPVHVGPRVLAQHDPAFCGFYQEIWAKIKLMKTLIKALVQLELYKYYGLQRLLMPVRLR